MFLSWSLIHTGIFTLTDFFLIIKNQKVTRTGKKKNIKLIVKGSY